MDERERENGLSQEDIERVKAIDKKKPKPTIGRKILEVIEETFTEPPRRDK